MMTRFLPLLGVVALLAPAGCRDPKQAGRGGTGPNVLLVTLDTTRADRLGCYGNSHAVTPTLDGLAQRGVRCERAFAQAPITLPSHTSILTGTLPPEHGVRDNGRFALEPDVPTLAEVFRARGYRTAAFIAAQVLNARFGLARGFETYDDRIPKFERRADEISAAALAWLQREPGRPFFAWLHYYDPHWPYQPPRSYLEKSVNPYDGEIAYMDAQLARVVDHLRQENLLADTLILAAGDHGESLGEHGYDWHALLVYDGTMRVPLLLSWPGHLPEGSVHAGVVSLADLAPTLLELLGWETPASMTGQSFAAALHGAEVPSRQSYGESEFPYYNFGWSPLRCLVEERWKYIRAPQPELYDRQQDPGERHNLATSQPAEVARLERELADWEQRMPRRAAAQLEVDPENLAALQALGYIGAPPSAAPPSVAGLKNPRDLVDIANNIRIAEAHLVEGTIPGAFAALALLEPAVARSPESFILQRDLGKAYAGAGLHDFAQPALEAALVLQPDSLECWAFLARVLKARGALDAAIQAAEHVLKLEPGNAEITKYLAEFRELRAKREQRLSELRAAQLQDPGSVEVAYELGELLIESGRTAEGLSVLRDALARHPDHPVLANALAWRLATNPRPELRAGAEAVTLARLACASEELRSSPDALDTLAAALAEAGQFEEAIATAHRAVAQAREQNDGWLAAVVTRRIALYSAGRPFHVPESLPGSVGSATRNVPESRPSSPATPKVIGP